VHNRDDMVGIDAALIMNTKVWESSGHLSNFSDPLVECEKCHQRFREDDNSQISNSQFLISKQIQNSKSSSYAKASEDKQKDKCPDCGGALTSPKQFNLMLKTFLGPTEDSASVVYFRPETAQAMFVDFKNVLETSRKTLPFGIAQQGKAFRNEITPGNFIFRTREFEQMEIEYFVRENDWEKYFEHWRKEMLGWMEDIGVDLNHVHELEVPDGERAHYSKRTIDFEYDFPFGREELYGLAYRTDFDLKNHFKEPPYRDQESGENFYPHIIEPTWGVDRSVLAALCSAYSEDGDRKVLKLKPSLAPYKVAVFPLVANKPDVVAKAREVYQTLKAKSYLLSFVAWDDRGNIGKRYYSQDEIGTPFCITIDYQTLEDGTVTVRDRDTTKQERVSVSDLASYIGEKISNN